MTDTGDFFISAAGKAALRCSQVIKANVVEINRRNPKSTVHRHELTNVPDTFDRGFLNLGSRTIHLYRVAEAKQNRGTMTARNRAKIPAAKPFPAVNTANNRSKKIAYEAVISL